MNRHSILQILKTLEEEKNSENAEILTTLQTDLIREARREGYQVARVFGRYLVWDWPLRMHHRPHYAAR